MEYTSTCFLTLDDEWDPTILDYITDDDADDNDDWHDVILNISTRHNNSLFNSTGEYKHRHIIHGIDINNQDITNGILSNNSIFYNALEHDSYKTHKINTADTQMITQSRNTIPNETDYKKIIPHFYGQFIESIKNTFNATTQYLLTPMSTHLTRYFSSSIPCTQHTTSPRIRYH